MIYLYACLAQMAFVFMKAFQQRNVAFDHVLWIPPTSIVMGMFEVIVVASIFHALDSAGNVLLVGFSIGVGGGVGALCAVLLHRRYMTRRACGPVDKSGSERK